jgi:hypothetical protein
VTADDMLTCVICLEKFPWDGRTTYRHTSTGPVRVDLPERDDPQWRVEIQDTFIRCPRQLGGLPHDFPVEFALVGEKPVVIGFVGDSNTGKTCLLVAMTIAIEQRKLADYNLSQVPASLSEHNRYVREKVTPFKVSGTIPAHTQLVNLVPIADALIVQVMGSTRRFPLVFFDANGETLRGEYENSHLATRFFQHVDGLIFVADPEKIGTGANVDPAYDAVMAQLTHAPRLPNGRLDIPAAIAVAKSDLHRFEAPVDQWLNREAPADGRLDPELIDQESRDAYAFLHHRGGTSWLSPLDQFNKCTLHFVSASGCSTVVEDPDGDRRFTRGARPRRVLEPLVALLDARGVFRVNARGN